MKNDEAINHLKKDKVLAEIINKYTIRLPDKVSTDLFKDLLEAIISQQLSVKAGATIFGRFLNIFPKKKNLSPVEVLNFSEETLHSCGISFKKVSYLKSLADEIVSGKLILDDLHKLSDEEVITKLTRVKGIGIWTAEMFLIFSLNRENIFSETDLGLRTAIAKLYKIDRNDKRRISRLSKRWSPYKSLACIYLWKSLENK